VTAIPAGGVSPFRVILPGVFSANVTLSAKVTSYTDPAARASLTGFAISLGGPLPIPVGERDPDTGITPMSPDLLAMDGTIVNTSNHNLRIEDLVLAVYREDGSVGMVVIADGLVTKMSDDLGAVLEPGESAAFRFSVPKGTLLALGGDVRTQVFVNGVALPTAG
jgi:hypothetical protein